MYIDAIIVVALIIAAVCWFRRFSKLVYAIAIIDLFLRLIDYIANNLGIREFQHWVNSVFPNSVYSIICKYSSGIFCTVLIWIYVVMMVFFLGYTFRSFLRKK